MPMDRPRRVCRTTENTDFFYSFPADNGKYRRHQKNSIRAELLRNPEILHYDFKTLNLDNSRTYTLDDEPSDIQFHTHRVSYWKEVTEEHFKDQGSWKDISSGKQLNIPRNIYMNFYDNGKVMIQGPQKMLFVNAYKQLQEAVNQREFTEQQRLSSSPTKDSNTAPEHDKQKGKLDTEQPSPQNTSTPQRETGFFRRMIQSFTKSPASGDRSVRNQSLSSLDESTASRLNALQDSESDSLADDEILTVPETQETEITSVQSSDEFSDEISDAQASALPTITGTAGSEAQRPLSPSPAEALSDEITKLKLRLMDKDSELERETEKAFQLSKDMKLMKLHLSQKDDTIKELELSLKLKTTDLDKTKKDQTKTKKQKDTVQQQIYELRKQRDQIDSENTNLREQSRQLQKTCDNVTDKLAIMTAKYNSLQHDSEPNAQAAVQASPAAQPLSRDIRQRDVRPKELVGAAPPRAKATVLPPSPSAWSNGPPRMNQPGPVRPAARAQGPVARATTKKSKVVVIGASNMRDMGSKIQTQKADAMVWVNPGCRMQDMQHRIHNMVTKDTDLALIHLGTNNALSQETDGQCLSQCSDALDKIERSIGSTPLLVCAVPPTHKKYGQRRVDMINDLIKYKCAKSHRMKFLDTKLRDSDISRDGVHLTTSGKSHLASTMKKAIQGFLSTQRSRSM